MTDLCEKSLPSERGAIAPSAKPLQALGGITQDLFTESRLK